MTYGNYLFCEASPPIVDKLQELTVWTYPRTIFRRWRTPRTCGTESWESQWWTTPWTRSKKYSNFSWCRIFPGKILLTQFHFENLYKLSLKIINQTLKITESCRKYFLISLWFDFIIIIHCIFLCHITYHKSLITSDIDRHYFK